MSDTIPPATAWAFEKYANEICDRAEVDREDKVLLAYEIQTHLQESWRGGIRLELTTEQAQQRAIEQFGNVRSVAKSLNEQDLRRLLLHESTRPTRIAIVFLFFWILACSRDMIEAFANNTYSSPRVSSSENFFKPLATLGFFYVVGHSEQYFSEFRAMLKDWFGMQIMDDKKPAQTGSFLSFILVSFKWVMILTGAFISSDTLSIFFFPISTSRLVLVKHLWTTHDFSIHFIALLIVLIVLVPMGINAFLSSASETFDWPRQKRERKKWVVWLFYRLPSLLNNCVLTKISGFFGQRHRI